MMRFASPPHTTLWLRALLRLRRWLHEPISLPFSGIQITRLANRALVQGLHEKLDLSLRV